MKLRRSLYARPEIVRGQRCALAPPCNIVRASSRQHTGSRGRLIRQRRWSTAIWWAWQGSNLRPRRCKRRALARLSYTPIMPFKGVSSVFHSTDRQPASRRCYRPSRVGRRPGYDASHRPVDTAMRWLRCAAAAASSGHSVSRWLTRVTSPLGFHDARSSSRRHPSPWWGRF